MKREKTEEKKILPVRKVGKCIGCGKNLKTYYNGYHRRLYENVPHLFCEECLNTDEVLY